MLESISGRLVAERKREQLSCCGQFEDAAVKADVVV
jgi:hypothetical protein